MFQSSEGRRRTGAGGRSLKKHATRQDTAGSWEGTCRVVCFFGGQTMADAAFQIRVMTRSEVDIALDWAAREGWNPGVHDADSFFAADPTGFLIGLLNDEPIATISVVKYDERFAFLGCYIVRPEFRGGGFGWRLWQAGMQSVEGRCVGLDGVVAQQSNYQKSGFRLAHRNIRYEGRGLGGPCKQRELVALGSLPIAEIERFDRTGFPVERSAFLQKWVTQPEARELGSVRDGQLTGYGVIRRCRVGLKIGPLFAKDSEMALRIFEALCSGVSTTTPIFLDVPETNLPALRLAERFAMRPMFETARMYAGPAPALNWNYVYGVTTFELG